MDCDVAIPNRISPGGNRRTASATRIDPCRTERPRAVPAGRRAARRPRLCRLLLRAAFLSLPVLGALSTEGHAATWEYRTGPGQGSLISTSVWVPDRSPYASPRGIFCIFLRDPYSVDLYLDPDWRTFWSERGFAVALFGVGGTTGDVDTTTTSYNGQTMPLRDAYLRVIADAGNALQRPGLANVPIIWWGHSATTLTVSGMVDYVPGRTAAFVSQHGFNYWDDMSATARMVPGIVTSGRLDTVSPWKDRTNALGELVSGTHDLFLSARQFGSAYTGGLEIDTGHGSGLYEAEARDRPGTKSVDRPLRTDPFHYRHQGNRFVDPPIQPGARDAWQLYNYQSRKGLLMPLLAEIIARRLPPGVFDPVANPLMTINQAGDWLAEIPPQEAGSADPARPPYGRFRIKSYASASERERKSWAWLPNHRLARIWQFYFSAGYTGGATAAGADIYALAPKAYVTGANRLGVLELRRPGTDAWRLDPNFGDDAYANNRTNTERWCTVTIQPSSTAVLGKDYVIPRSPFVSYNLAGRQNEGYGEVNPYSPAVPSIPQWYQPPNSIRFFDRVATSYITIRALDDVNRVADRRVVLSLTNCGGLPVGARSTATIIVKPHGVAAP